MKHLLVVALFVGGCANVTNAPLTERQLIGSYSNHDPFCPRTLELRKDGSFAYDQFTDNIVEDKNGRMVFEGSWGMRGSWTFQAPDRVEIVTDRQKDHFVFYVRASAKKQIVILEPHLFPNILKTWSPSSHSTFTSEFLTK